jgi:hypothetical protein
MDLDAYSIVVKNYLDTAADILIFGSYRFYGSERKEHTEKTPFFDHTGILERQDALRQLILDDKINNYMWNKIFTRRIFNGVYFTPGRLYEDVLIMHTLFLRAEKISVISTYKYYYFQRRDSISNSRIFDNELKRFDAFLDRYYDLEDNPLVDRKLLLTKTAAVIFEILHMFPFQIKGGHKIKIAGFLRKNRKTLTRCPLPLRDRTACIVPFAFLPFFYSPPAAAIYTLVRRCTKRLLITRVKTC